MLEFDGFDWDDYNLYKSERKHGISRASIERAFLGGISLLFFDSKHSVQEQRYIAIAECDGPRLLFIIFTLRRRDGLDLIRPISARYMHEKEREKYKKEIAST